MLTTKILRTIQRHLMVTPDSRVLVGLSGGADSVAMLSALHELRHSLGIELVAAHLDHGLRAEASDDQAFCRALAAELDVAFVSGQVDVSGRARAAKRSIEAEARDARYAFLSDTATETRCTAIAVGHTMDDQAETLVMRLARGSSCRGLSSVYPVVHQGDTAIIRPLLEVSRREILDYLDERGLAHREDPSNRDRRFTRNRVRHDVLPLIARELNGNLVQTLARSADILRDEEAFMEGRASEAFAHAAKTEDGRLKLSVTNLREHHPAIRRRMTRLAVESVLGDTHNLTAEHVADVLKLLDNGKSGRVIHLPRLTAERSFDALEFSPRGARDRREPGTNGYNGFDYRLSIPAELRIEECRGLLTAHLMESVRARGEPDEPVVAAGNAVLVGVENGLSELRVRSPRATDRFRPLGAPGSKPIMRYLMERKVAKRDRRHVPLVVRADRDEILWVAGHAVSEAARLGAGRRRLQLEWMSQ